MCDKHLKPLNKNNLNKKALHASKNKERRKLLQHIYNSKKWKTLRNEYIEHHQCCELCGEPATTVHHIKKFSSGLNKKEIEHLAYDANNLQALCLSCHFKQHHNN